MPKSGEYQPQALDNHEDFVGEPISIFRLPLVAACPANGDKQTASSEDERHPHNRGYHNQTSSLSILFNSFRIDRTRTEREG